MRTVRLAVTVEGTDGHLAPEEVAGFVAETLSRALDGYTVSVKLDNRGQHGGRPRALTAQQEAEVDAMRRVGSTVAELAASYGVSEDTIRRVSS